MRDDFDSQTAPERRARRHADEPPAPWSSEAVLASESWRERSVAGAPGGADVGAGTGQGGRPG
ncbi:MAG: hypothetical protein QM606_03880, partial [Leucobacter sp.]